MRRTSILRYFLLFLVGFNAAKVWGQVNHRAINKISAASVPSDYFRSKTNGDWAVAATWESSPDNNSWITATSTPTSAANIIIIQSGHTVTVTTTISLDQTIISGMLDVHTGGVINMDDGTGADINISGGGILRAQSASNYNAVFIYGGSSNINIANGGKITVGNGAGAVGSNYEGFATSTVNNWNDDAVFEWNALSTFKLSGLTYFPNAGVAIPVFTITSVSGTPTSGSTGTTINGIIEINTSLTLAGGSIKTFRDGIRGTATLTENSTSGNSFHITSSNAILDGSLMLALSSPLNLANGITIPFGADVKISGANISKAAGSFFVDGTIDLSDIAISNTSGDVMVNGTLKTARTNGLYNPGNIASGVVNINPGSTIEYNASVDQAVSTNINYYNVTFSAGGTKTPVGSLTAMGTVKITGGVVVDGGTNNIGGTGTNFTMDGGRFILGTTGTQPNMTGTYNITGGVLQFTNSSVTGQTIRSPQTYYNIEVTGKNVGNSFGNITLSAGATFTIKSGGIFTINADQITGLPGIQTVIVENGAKFKCGNADGFSGGNGTLGNITAIKSDIESIILNTGDTVEYSRATSGGNQIVTTAISYGNVILSGAGIKNVTGGTFSLNANGSLDIRSTTRFDADNSTTLNFNNRPVYVRSDIAGTGSVGDLTGVTVLNKNDFTVERYIPAHRAWRLLTAPVISSQTINQSWQENQTNPDLNYANNSDLVKGYGTHITGNTQSTVFGYDPGPQNNFSLKIYDISRNSITGWSGLPTGTGTNNTMVNSYPGLMLFVRGNRSLKLSDGPIAPATPAILRTNGQLISGNQFINIAASGFTLIGNPYPSSLDMRNIARSGGVDPFFYVWDPHLGSIGGYQTFSLSGGNFIPSPGGGSYSGVNNYIQSGMAFFVHTSSAATVQIKEISKAGLGTNSVFRITKPVKQLRTNLYTSNSEGSILLDGVLSTFNENGHNKLDGSDAIKMNNFSESIGMIRERKILVVEDRQDINSADTIFYNTTQLGQKNYFLEFIAEGLARPGLSAFLEDGYTGKKTNIDLNGTTRINFNISDPAAAAADRFRLVFTHCKPQLMPIVTTKAGQQNNAVAIN